MSPVKIVTDSSSDLPAHIVAELGITVVPLIVRFGDEVFYDGVMPVEDFWARVMSGQHPATSQPAVGTFQEVFERLTADGSSVLCITITSKHSGTYNSAWSAARMVKGHVEVFDSLSLSWGLGFQVWEAAKLVQQGAEIPDIVAHLEGLRNRSHVYILLDTMEFLRRGGRADGVFPIVDRIARALRIKIILVLVEGALQLLGPVRTYDKGLARLRDEILRLGPLAHLAVMHTRRPDQAIALADELASLTGIPRDEIYVSETGAALSTHGGPGVMGVIGITKD